MGIGFNTQNNIILGDIMSDTFIESAKKLYTENEDKIARIRKKLSNTDIPLEQRQYRKQIFEIEKEQSRIREIYKQKIGKNIDE